MKKLAFLAEHREIDKCRAAAVLGTVADRNAAEIDARHRFETLDQFFARWLRSGAPEPFHEHFGGDEPFDRRVRGQHVMAFDRLQKFAGDRRRDREWIRRNLADDDTVYVAA